MGRSVPLVLAGFVLAAFLLPGCSSASRPLEDLGPVADFALQERDGREVHRNDLKGKVWVASFIFTRCGGPCPQVSATMARLQTELSDQADARLVTFTVDPNHDTRGVLEEYARGLGADADRWLFLTGSQDEIYRLIKESFHLGVEQNQGSDRKPGREVLHATKIVLIDRQGHIRGYFDGRQVDDDGSPIDSVPSVRQHVLDLLREK